MGDLSTMAENYLKVIWNAGEWTDEPITVGALASKLGLAPSSVSEAIGKLHNRGLVAHARYGAIELTDSGGRAALRMVRRHRLIETFLVEYLGYGWDEVHAEAEVLEHAVSDQFIERLTSRLGEPSRDPHGDPIPNDDGTLPALVTIPLSRARIGSIVRVGRVSDSDSALLRYLDELGIGLDTVIAVRARHDSLGTIRIEHGGHRIDLGLPAAEAIRVLPIDEEARANPSTSASDLK